MSKDAASRRFFSVIFCLAILYAGQALATASGIDTPPGTVNPAIPFALNGTPMMTLTTTGLGIGSTTPAYMLDVTGNTHVTGNAYMTGNVGIGNTNPQDKLDVSGGVTITGSWTGDAENGLHEFFTSNISYIYSIQAGVAWRQLTIDGSPLILNANSDGNVGIGKTPAYKLDVNGAINATQYYINGQPLFNGQQLYSCPKILVQESDCVGQVSTLNYCILYRWSDSSSKTYYACTPI